MKEKNNPTSRDRRKRDAFKDEEYLITYTRHLEKRMRNLETEKQLLDAERLRLEQELNSLRNEIDRMREPPLLVAVVVSVSEDKDKVTVLLSTGPLYTVSVSRKVKNLDLEPGMFVSLNQRTYAIMDVLTITTEDVYAAKKKLVKDY